ncbi:LuxR C-terminal-related transcriptional regulator [Kitasatospora sp. NPDC006697]|uniref:LuxR C-terminal-related transcriptional regulator n=1 Tax=Kitasatospora sp. NPDC006697 TaxID=3364020 RepID=UPI0036846A7F
MNVPPPPSDPPPAGPDAPAAVPAVSAAPGASAVPVLPAVPLVSVEAVSADEAAGTGEGLVGGLPLPGEGARSRYLAILGAGGRLRSTEVRPADQPEIAELLELGLLRLDPVGGCYTVVNPRSVGGRLSEELRSAGTRLLVQAQEMPTLLEDLTLAYDQTPRKVDRSGEVQHVHGAEEVWARLRRLRDTTAEELLSAQPGGALGQHMLENALSCLRSMVERGVSVRSLYEPSARADGPTVAFVLTADEFGVRCRVLGESFKRMLIFDRTTVVIPSGRDYTSAAFVEDPAVVAFLIGMFERDWARAEPSLWSPTAPESSAQPVHVQVGRLLAQGLTQRMIAARLGLSDRTVAGHISRLREQYDAETLFQLGWLMRAANGDGRAEPGR